MPSFSSLVNYLKKIRHFITSNRYFFYAWLAEMFSEAALNLIIIIISILSSEGFGGSNLKNSSFGIAILLNFATFPGLILAPLTGVIADWFPKKKIVIIVNTLRFLAVFIFIIFSGWNNVFVAYGLILVLSVILQFAIPAEGGLVPLLVKKENLLFANSLYTIDIYGTLIIDFFIAGILLSVIGIPMTFVFICLLFLICLFFVFQIKVTNEKIDQTKSINDFTQIIRKLFKDVKEGMVFAFKSSTVRFSLIHLFFLQLVAIFLLTLIFRIADEIFNVSPRTAGLVVLTPLGLGVLIGFILMNTRFRKIKRVKLTLVGTFFSSLAFFLITILSISSFEFLERYSMRKFLGGAGLGFFGFSLPFLLIPAQTMIYENTKVGFRGRVLGIWTALTSSFSAFLSIAFGYITDRINNLTFPLAFVGIIASLYSFLIFKFAKKEVEK